MTSNDTLYILRPELVHAWRLTEENRYDAASWPEFVRDAYQHALAGNEGPIALVGSPPNCQILVQGVELNIGDWAVLDEQGVFFVMSDDAFFATFEPATINEDGEISLDLPTEQEEFYCESCLREWDTCDCPEG